MKNELLLTFALTVTFSLDCVRPLAAADRPARAEAWVETLVCPDEPLTNVGRNAYCILEPGYQLVLAGEEDGKKIELIITVLPDTQDVGGVPTRVVEERETIAGKLVEVSRNFVALGQTTRHVYYLGEDVDVYRGEQVVHEGAWRAGQNGAKHGILLPGTIRIGDRYYQEMAPGVAMDRAENVATNQTVRTPAGTFKDCLQVRETTPLEAGTEHKFYAPGVGLVQDADLKLVRHGWTKR